MMVMCRFRFLFPLWIPLPKAPEPSRLLDWDWSTLKKTDSKDPGFENDDNNGDGSNSGNTAQWNEQHRKRFSRGNNGSLSTNSNGSLSGSTPRLEEAP